MVACDLKDLYPAGIARGCWELSTTGAGEEKRGHHMPKKGDKLHDACMPHFDARTIEEDAANIDGIGRRQRTHWKGACRAKVNGGT
jgi:hypothetical protein